jgi:hypothetical protein
MRVSDRKQVKRYNPIGVLGEEHFTALRWRSPVPCHVLGDRGLTNIGAELEQSQCAA